MPSFASQAEIRSHRRQCNRLLMFKQPDHTTDNGIIKVDNQLYHTIDIPPAL